MNHDRRPVFTLSSSLLLLTISPLYGSFVKILLEEQKCSHRNFPERLVGERIASLEPVIS